MEERRHLLALLDVCGGIKPAKNFPLHAVALNAVLEEIEGSESAPANMTFDPTTEKEVGEKNDY